MINIAIIGLGYVGLPLANLFAKIYSVVGFDINENRVNDLRNGHDFNFEFSAQEIRNIQKTTNDNQPGLFITSQLDDIKLCNYYIVTVPTPVDNLKRPDLKPLFNACNLVGKVLKTNDIVIFESTVYPGVTEEECVPILEEKSGFIFNQDFFVGYSPERINPGDKLHTIDKIIKITSGSNYEVSKKVDDLYKSILLNGTYLAPSIRIAEAAKVVENTQRDVNIAFINELSKIFNLMGLNINEILKAAGTKWNFLNFKPGLVGGHCIGVDPYYLVHKSQSLGFNPEIIIASRVVNEGMAKYICSQIIKLMINQGINLINAKVLILGASFKDNCAQFKNTKSVDLINSFLDYNIYVDCYDPLVNKDEFYAEYRITILENIPNYKYDALVVLTAHDIFLKLDIKRLLKENSVKYDIKGIFNS